MATKAKFIWETAGLGHWAQNLSISNNRKQKFGIDVIGDVIYFAFTDQYQVYVSRNRVKKNTSMPLHVRMAIML